MARGGSAYIVWNPAGLSQLLKSAGGPVGQDLIRRATAVANQARLNASRRPGPMVDTGRLRSSITYAVGNDSEGIYADVGTNVDYGLYLELGTSRMPPYPYLAPALEAART